MQISILAIFKSALSALLIFWPIYALGLLLLVAAYFFRLLDVKVDNLIIRNKFKKGEAWRSDRDLIQWLRGMNPTEFEVYIADLFRRLGYKTEQIGGSHDGGVDVIAEKDGVKHYIQCKKYFAKREVGSPDIRDFYGAVADRLSNGEGWFITTNKFTPEAEKFAEDKPIILINQFKLVEYIRLAEKKGFESSHQNKPIEKCPEDGGMIVERSGKFGKFLGCSNYPKCKYTINIAVRV